MSSENKSKGAKLGLALIVIVLVFLAGFYTAHKGPMVFNCAKTCVTIGE